MVIVVTGVSGLIGAALRERLVDSGLRVLGVDVRDGANLRLDVRDARSFMPGVGEVSGIVHLAAVSRVIDGERDPELCHSVNVDGTHAIVDAALACRSRPWLIYASSREVYGEAGSLPVREDAEIAPMNTYGHSKAAAENIVRAARNSGLRAAIVRFSNVYGRTRDYPDRVIPAFTAAAARGDVLRVEGADRTFDFTHVDDVTDAILRLIGLFEEDSAPAIDALHLVSGRPTTLGELAAEVLKCSNPGTRIIEATPRAYDVQRFYGDPSLTARVLGWRASTDLKDGLARLVEHFCARSSVMRL